MRSKIKRWLTYGIVAALIIIAALVALYACKSEYSLSDGRDSSAISLKPLDDADNPYKNQYQAIDEWTYANVVSISDEKDDAPFRNRQDGEFLMAGFLDSQSCLLPYHKFVELGEEAVKSGKPRTSVDGYKHVYAVGEMDKNLANAAWELAWSVRANYYMDVPAWLVEKPAKATMLFPNGDVVTYGELGWEDKPKDEGGLGDDDDGCCGGGVPGVSGVYRFNHEGELLAFTNKSSWWTLFYDTEALGWPGIPELLRRDGYMIFKDEQDRTVVYDFDGTLLDSREEPPFRDVHPFTPLNPKQIRLVYAAQSR